jgi:leader peptidase (prepilin peptidase) / N-methyltransferase
MIELFASSAPLFIGTVFVLSLLIGSFLNVVIHRLPIMLDREWKAQAAEVLAQPSGSSSPTAYSLQPAALPKYNLIVPRSACPNCGAPIGALQNIPVISYLVLKGRCSGCRAPISVRYPIVELGTAILSAVVAWKFGFTAFTAAALLLTWTLIALTCIDIDHQVLPDNLTLSLMWAGLLVSLAAPAANSATLPVNTQDSLIGAAAGYLSLWLVYHLFKALTGKEGMGYGDFKLLAALGAWLGWQMLPLVILLSAVTGAIIGILMIALRGRDRNIPIPFGPYLAAAGWIALLWGPELVDAYLRQLR